MYSESAFSHRHAVLQRKRNITNTVPHGVDLEQLTVGGEALHLLLPENIVGESNLTGGVQQTSDEIVDGRRRQVELLLLGAVHGLDADLTLQQADQLLTNGRTGAHTGHGGDLLHGRKTNLGKVALGMQSGGILAVGTHQGHHVGGVKMLEITIIRRTVEVTSKTLLYH